MLTTFSLFSPFVCVGGGRREGAPRFYIYFVFNSVFLSEFLVETMYVEFLCVTIFMLRVLM